MSYDDNLDRDENNPIDMNDEAWTKFYCEWLSCKNDSEAFDEDFDEYLDHDHSMDY